MSSSEIPSSYIYPTNAKRWIRLFVTTGYSATPLTTLFYTVPQDKIIKVTQVIITSSFGGWANYDLGIFFRSQAGNEIASFQRNSGTADYSDDVYNFDEKLILYGGDKIQTETANSIGVGAWLYAVVFGVEEMNPYLYPTN